MDAIESVRVAKVKSVLPIEAGAEVVVAIRGRMFPLRLRFAARDVDVAGRFAEMLTRATEAPYGSYIKIPPRSFLAFACVS